jgi:hypothetical protein
VNETPSDVKRKAKRPKDDECDDDEPDKSRHDFLPLLAFGDQLS